MGDFTMPSLGADMDAGTVTEWLVKPGDEVHRGDIVAVVDTEKATIEVEIFENGVIEQLLVGEGQQVPVGTVLARVGSGHPGPSGKAAELVHSPVLRHLADRLGVDLGAVGGTGPGGSVTRADVESAAATGRAARRPQAEQVRQPGPERRAAPVPRSSPLARRRAAELGVGLDGIGGHGPGGAIVEADVLAAAGSAGAGSAGAGAEVTVTTTLVAGGTQPRPAAAAGSRREAMRRVTGELMARSKREIPHYYLSTTIDAAAAMSWLEATNLERPVADRLVASILLLKAAAMAATRVPEVNGFFVDGSFVPGPRVHLGVAISLRGGGLVAPAIHDAAELGLGDLMAALRDLVGRARAGRLRSTEVSEATMTVTNLGDLGVESVFGVIYSPQVALVGFGRVEQRPVARDGMIGVRPCVTATLSADHRVSDGHRGARYLAEVDRLLQRPETL